MCEYHCVEDYNKSSNHPPIIATIYEALGDRRNSIRLVEHSRGWCTWDEFRLFADKNIKKDYFNYIHIDGDLRIWGHTWMMFFIQDDDYEPRSKWCIVPLNPMTEKKSGETHAIPEKDTFLSSMYPSLI